uniref:MFS transporter n=1 Tax=Anaerolinea thermolimosa TaxID=229919 RepID=A0A7C4PIJ4_9CHLR
MDGHRPAVFGVISFEGNVPHSWKWVDYVRININFFALSARSQTLAPLVVPLLVQQFVGEDVKGGAYGAIRLWALLAGLLAQAFFGMISDRTRSRWGRRRIFVAAGTILESVILLGMGTLAGMQGREGVGLLLTLYVLSMIASNASNVATLSFIPDLVPEQHRGLASGVKVWFEVPLPLLFVALVTGRLIAQGQMMAALAVLVGCMLACMLMTMTVPEEPWVAEAGGAFWKPLARLVAMTAVFAGVILGAGAGVKAALSLAQGLEATPGLIAGGGMGLLAMALTVGAGVWLGLRVALGEAFHTGANPSFTWWVINRLAWLTASNNIGGFLLFYFQEKFPQWRGEQAAAPVAGVLFIAGMFTLSAALIGGWLADRVEKKPLVAWSSLLGALGTAGVILAPTPGWVYASGGLFGAAVGLFYSASWALGTQLVSPAQTGALLGLSNLAGAGAGAVGAYLGGPIADQFGYALLLAILGALFLLSNLALSQVAEPGANGPPRKGFNQPQR